MEDNHVIVDESRKPKEHQNNYVVYDLDLAASIEALKMWSYYLFGKKLTLVIDHINLKYFFS